MRERWFGSRGIRVPELAVEGDERVPLDGVLVIEDVSDPEPLRSAHASGTPVVVRASTAEGVKAALSRPEVAAVLVPESARELLELDLTRLTYG